MIEPFAVEHDTVQLWWPRMANGPHEVAVGELAVGVVATGGPGAALVRGLPPATTMPIRLDGVEVGRVTTRHEMPGRLLHRIATMSDVHIGEDGFGAVFERRERHPVEPYAVRCLRAALGAAAAGGAERVVIKGDLTQGARAEEFEAGARILAGAGVPVSVTWGNHDVQSGGVDGAPILARHGIQAIVEPTAIDLSNGGADGLRLIIADSTIPGLHHGTLTGRRDALLQLAEMAADEGRPCMLLQHHQFYRTAPRFWPPGIFVGEAAPFLRALERANPRTFISSGHTHRNRSHRWGSMVMTEVGSTKDYPGSWASYAIHEGGIRQTVWRVTGHDTDGWLHGTRRALGGVWGRWSPGSLSQRCVDAIWA